MARTGIRRCIEPDCNRIIQPSDSKAGRPRERCDFCREVRRLVKANESHALWRAAGKKPKSAKALARWLARRDEYERRAKERARKREKWIAENRAYAAAARLAYELATGKRVPV